MLKQRRILLKEVHRGLVILGGIPVWYVKIDMANALVLAAQINTYAYDAYLLDCASRHSAPLLTLYAPLRRAATKIGVNLIEI